MRLAFLFALLLAGPASAEVIGSLTLDGADFYGPADTEPEIQALAGYPAIADNWPAAVELRAYRYGASAPTKKVWIIGGIHGDEAVSYLTAELLVRQLEVLDDPLRKRLEEAGIELTIVPLMNPYGTLAGVRPNFRRSNTTEDALAPELRPEWWDWRRGVDLNRNFPMNLPGSALQRPDGEGTHQFDARGGCVDQHYYYGGLLHLPEQAPEPANAWLLELVQASRPDVIIALHQELGLIFADSKLPLKSGQHAWGPFVARSHAALNAAAPGAVKYGRNKEGRRIPPEDAVNDFSPGGYGVALSQFSEIVVTVEMTYDQSDALEGTCWFPEGQLSTYAEGIELTQLHNVERLEPILARFRPLLANYIFRLDPQHPRAFSMDARLHPEVIGAEEARRLILPPSPTAPPPQPPSSPSRGGGSNDC